jgi:hypothetical protein
MLFEALAAGGLVGCGFCWGYIKAWREFRRQLNRRQPLYLEPRPSLLRRTR